MTAASRPLLETPFVLAGKRLRNRIVHASMTTLRARDGGTTAAQIQYYENRARGGAAMIVTEPLTWSSLHDVVHKTRAWSEANVDGLKRWAEAVESHDCRLLGQIQDPGRARHNVGRHVNAIAPSALPDDLSWSMPRALRSDEIRRLVADFALSSERLKRCGFSGVELSAGHGHLFHQFFSPRSNHRDDEYGIDWEGRTRFVRELIGAIRSTCGDDFIVGLKLPGDDGLEDSIGPREAAIIARLVTASGEASYVCFAQGTHARTLEMHVPDRHGPRMPYRQLIRDLRKSVPGVPLMSLGRITDPAEAEGLLASGEAELIGLGRALVADPAWPIKAAAGRTNDIRYCISCNTCWDTIITRHEPMACVNNPRVAEPDEVDWWPQQSLSPKRVVVVGSGVAGLEAAWIAAARGHAVTVLARAGEVGGKARLRTHLPGGEDSSSIYDYQIVASQRAGVRFEMGIDAGLEDVIRLKPDAVVLATGATMVPPAWLPPDVAREGLVPDLRAAMQDLVSLEARQPGTAVVFDMDHSEGTYAAAERLAALFQRVVLITPRNSLADDTSLVTRQGIQRRVAAKRIETIFLSEPVWSDAFEQGELEYRHLYSGQRLSIAEVAFLSYSTPRARNDQLWVPLRDAGIEVHRVGDCLSPRDLLAATADGHRVG